MLFRNHNKLTCKDSGIAYIPRLSTFSYQVKEEKYNAYFAERLEKLLESPSDKTHAYQLNNDIDTKHDDEVEPQTIKKVKEEINNNITCNPTQIQELIKAKAFKDGYAKKDDTISNVNIYYKEKVVGTSSYSFSGNVIDLTTPEKQTNIATNISKNLKNLLHVTDEEVETAIKATEKSEFSKDDVLSVKLECTSNTPSDEYYLKDYILDDNKATVDYSFDDTTEVYKDSDDRKKTINIIVDKINTKEKKKQANNIYYKTDYSAVDKVLPEKVYGTKDKDKQTKLDVQLTKVEIKYSYKKINKESIGNKTYIVVETDKPKDSIIKVKIYEKEPLLAEAGTTLKVLHATKETGLINTKSDGKGKAIGEITLRPHSDEKFDTWRKKLEPEAQTKLVDKLWLKVENKHEFLKGSEFELELDSGAPWMPFALAELKKHKGLVEKDTLLHESLKKYLETTNASEFMESYKPNYYKISWCASFVNWCFNQTSKYKNINSGLNALAYDWAFTSSEKVKNHKAKPNGWIEGEKCQAFYGAVIVFNYSHIAFIIGLNESGTRYIYVGGNQGSNIEGKSKLSYGSIKIGNEHAIMKPKNYNISNNEKILPKLKLNPKEETYETTH